MLRGNSGAQIMRLENRVFKHYTGPETLRFLKGALKQIEFLPWGAFRAVPITRMEGSQKEYSIEMPYIDGMNAIEFFDMASDVEFAQFMKDVIAFLDNEFKNCHEKEVPDVRLKIVDLHTKCPELQILKFYQPKEIPIGNCHGDFAIGNMIFRRGDIFLTDFLETFIASPVLDVAKLYQDLELQLLWSFNEAFLSQTTVQRCHDFKTKLDEMCFTWNISEDLNFWKAMNLARVFPYTRDNLIRNGLLKAINGLCS